MTWGQRLHILLALPEVVIEISELPICMGMPKRIGKRSGASGR